MDSRVKILYAKQEGYASYGSGAARCYHRALALDEEHPEALGGVAVLVVRMSDCGFACWDSIEKLARSSNETSWNTWAEVQLTSVP